jgi:chemotaxis protein CheY-P-specific phosphatase CheC
MENRSRENFIVHVMNTGFDRAASSFSKLIGRSVRVTHSPSVVVRHDNDFSCVSEEEGDLYVLTTQIIGEISGKSFLIFNEDESFEIFKTLGTNISDQLKEAFLMEIDNIISASVISDLSNALEIEVYGDVPHLRRIHSADLQDYMNDEVSKEGQSSMIFSNTTFHFDSGEQIHPQFVWKLSSKVFEMIPTEKLVA